MDPHVVAPRLALFAADETFAREIRLARLGHALGGAAKDADRLEHDVAAAIK